MSERDGINGTCVNIRRCMSVVYDIKRRNYPQLCSFQGLEPIICCTDCDLVEDNNKVVVDKDGYNYVKTGQKAADKCMDYVVSLKYNCKDPGMKRDLYDEKMCYLYSTYRKPTFMTLTEFIGDDNVKKSYANMALLGYGDNLEGAQWLCGGSVISEQFVLTSAHCVSDAKLGPVRYIALDALYRSETPETWQRHTVRRIIFHPQYKSPSKYHDIALLETDKTIEFSDYVVPACLYTGEDEDDNVAYANGWKGAEYFYNKLRLKKYTDKDCADTYPRDNFLKTGYDPKTQTCYGYKKRVNDLACENDSRAPIQAGSFLLKCNKIIGVTSYDRACDRLGGPILYTKVQYYLPWIENIVWP